MSANYVLEELKKIDDIDKRRVEADRLFEVLPEYLPSGAHNPNFFPFGHPDSQLLSNLKWGEEVFSQIKQLCGGEFTPVLQQSYDNFLRNAEYTKKMIGMNWEDRRNLETHQFFPFWNDFNKAVQALFSSNPWSEIKIEKLSFEPNIIGKGGFATVYKAKDNNGKKYALKLFHPFFLYTADERNLRNDMIRLIAKNICSQDELWKQKPFIPIRAVNRTECQYSQFAYIMDFFEGESVRNLMENKPRKMDDSMVGRILLVYSEMLGNLHSQKKIFLDHDWSNVLVNDDEIRICDFDFVTSVDQLEENRFYPHHSLFASREHLIKKKPTFSGDLESLALMAHKIITNEDFLTIEWDKRRENSEKAEQNKRQYPEQYRPLLPRRLQEIIPALITYPRDDSINANDFLSAIKSDFRL